MRDLTKKDLTNAAELNDWKIESFVNFESNEIKQTMIRLNISGSFWYVWEELSYKGSSIDVLTYQHRWNEAKQTACKRANIQKHAEQLIINSVAYKPMFKLSEYALFNAFDVLERMCIRYNNHLIKMSNLKQPAAAEKSRQMVDKIGAQIRVKIAQIPQEQFITVNDYSDKYEELLNTHFYPIGRKEQLDTMIEKGYITDKDIQLIREAGNLPVDMQTIRQPKSLGEIEIEEEPEIREVLPEVVEDKNTFFFQCMYSEPRKFYFKDFQQAIRYGRYICKKFASNYSEFYTVTINGHYLLRMNADGQIFEAQRKPEDITPRTDLYIQTAEQDHEQGANEFYDITEESTPAPEQEPQQEAQEIEERDIYILTYSYMESPFKYYFDAWESAEQFAKDCLRMREQQQGGSIEARIIINGHYALSLKADGSMQCYSIREDLRTPKAELLEKCKNQAVHMAPSKHYKQEQPKREFIEGIDSKEYKYQGQKVVVTIKRFKDLKHGDNFKVAFVNGKEYRESDTESADMMYLHLIQSKEILNYVTAEKIAERYKVNSEARAMIKRYIKKWLKTVKGEQDFKKMDWHIVDVDTMYWLWSVVYKQICFDDSNANVIKIDGKRVFKQDYDFSFYLCGANDTHMRTALNLVLTELQNEQKK